MSLRRLRSRGQATAEYILIVVLVAVLSIGIITVFGNQIRDLYRVATERLTGENAKLDPSITSGAAKEVNRGLGDLKNGG